VKTLLALVLHRADSEIGYARLTKVTVWRLREDLAQAVGIERAKALIETGVTNEYRLSIPRDQLKSQVALTPCFAELVPLEILTKRQYAKLRRICGRSVSKFK
jgi:hypothetical protein